MEKESSLPKVGFALTMVAFAYFVTILVIQNASLNFVTWILWTVIDVALLISMVKAGNRRPWIMMGFTTGATAITAIALYKLIVGQSVLLWGSTETLALVVVSIAMIVWRYTSNNGGVVAITVAMYIAMIPTLVDGWTEPVGQDPWFWGISSIACLLTFLGSPWTIAGRFMPAFGTVFNGLMAVLIFWQFL